jgi:hypothetical protein
MFLGAAALCFAMRVRSHLTDQQNGRTSS